MRPSLRRTIGAILMVGSFYFLKNMSPLPWIGLGILTLGIVIVLGVFPRTRRS